MSEAKKRPYTKTRTLRGTLIQSRESEEEYQTMKLVAHVKHQGIDHELKDRIESLLEQHVGKEVTITIHEHALKGGL